MVTAVQLQSTLCSPNFNPNPNPNPGSTVHSAPLIGYGHTNPNMAVPEPISLELLDYTTGQKRTPLSCL